MKKTTLATLLIAGLVTSTACMTRSGQEDPSVAGTGSRTEAEVMSGQAGESAAADATAETRAGTGSGTGSGQPSGNLSAQDRSFALEAASSGMMEVEAGRLASQRGANAAVRSFGQHMVTDHSQANQRLMAVAGRKGLDLPREMMPQHRQQLDRLSNLSGDEFDRAYMEQMLAAHQKDVTSFEQQARNGKDADLRAFAQETLPTLREHYQLAQSVASQTGERQAGTP